jgi:hypothetical protein
MGEERLTGLFLTANTHDNVRLILHQCRCLSGFSNDVPTHKVKTQVATILTPLS